MSRIKIRNYVEYVDLLRHVNKQNKGRVSDDEIDKLLTEYELTERFGINRIDVKADLFNIRKEINSYQEYIGYVQTMFIMAAGDVNDELIEDFIAEFNLDSRFDIVKDDVRKDIISTSQKVNSYKQYTDALKNLFSVCKEKVESADIENFIKAYKLDERFDISFNDVMQDLIVVKTNSDIEKREIKSNKSNFYEWKNVFKLLHLDAKIEGRKEGYNIASREFEPIFILYKNIFAKVKQIVNEDKVEYGSKALLLNEQLKELEMQREKVNVNYDDKIKIIAKSYNVNVGELKKEVIKFNSDSNIYDGISKFMTIATTINPIIGLRSANYIKYKRIGYNEAKQVHIDIYDDRMEIYSPGGMPDGSLIQERDPLTVPSTRRNPVLADVFNRLGYMERKGSGFGRIISSYEFQANYREDKKPKFRSDRYQFTVVLPNLNYGVESIDITDVNSDVNVDVKQKIKEAILEDSKVTQRELVVKLGVSYRQIQQNMAEMVSGGEIVRVGSNRSGYWEIIE